MNRRRTGIILLFLAAFIPLILIIWKRADELQDTGYFQTLSIELNGHGSGSVIKAYYDENHASDAWYFFLPSCAELSESPVHFSGADHLEIEDINGNLQNIPNGGYLTGLNRDETYLVRFVSGSGNVLADGKIVYMQSENLPAAFIYTETGSMDHLNLSKKNTEKGEMTIFTADGTVDFTGALDMIKSEI